MWLVIDCSDPGTPQNGSRILQGTKFEATVKYRCDIGFQLNGAEMRTCQVDGTWTGSLPACQGVCMCVCACLCGHVCG